MSVERYLPDTSETRAADLIRRINDKNNWSERDRADWRAIQDKSIAGSVAESDVKFGMFLAHSVALRMNEDFDDMSFSEDDDY